MFSRSDIFGVIIAAFPLGAGLVVATLSKGTIRKFGVAVMALSVVGFLVWAVFYRADAQTPAPNVTNNGGCLNIGPSQGPQTNNCPTTIINPPPLRSPLGIYQSGQQIGRVQDASFDLPGNTVTLTNPRIASGSVDGTQNFEFRDFIINCPELAKMINPNAGMNSVMIGGTTNCGIVGKR